jgi:cystathionine beta-synthase
MADRSPILRYSTSGIALALLAAIKGYRCVITISEKMSTEKVLVLRSLGATIFRTPAGVPVEHPESIISVAKRLRNEIPNSHILDQYANPNNPLAHEFGTAEEIWSQTGGEVDVVVVGVGTGGALTGIAKGLHKHNPKIMIIGVDPVGSVLAQPQALHTVSQEYKVEGIGYDFMPQVLDQSAADLWVKTTDKDSFLYARRLIREEGFLCGGSSGAVIAGLAQAVKSHPEINQPGKKIVVILPDSIRNYLTKFVDDKWMEENGYVDFAQDVQGFSVEQDQNVVNK